MIKLGSEIAALINDNPTLILFIRNKWLNLSQFARYLNPLLAARAKKDISNSTIVMALSRFQKTLENQQKQIDKIEFKFGSMNITSNLTGYTFRNTPNTRDKINNLYGKIQKKDGFITLTEASEEISVFVSQVHAKIIIDNISDKYTSYYGKLASIGIKFEKKYCTFPGFFHSVFQLLYLQNINIVEITSTNTELILFLDESEIRLAFDSLYNRFIQNKS